MCNKNTACNRKPSLVRNVSEIYYRNTGGKWRGLKQKDRFAVRWTGSLQIDTAGEYAFEIGSDDGSKMLIGNSIIVDNDGLHGYRRKTGKKQLSAGVHSVKVEFFENTGHAGMGFKYKGPDTGGKLAQVPAKAFCAAAPVPTMPPTFAPTPAPTMPPTPAPTPWYCVASASRKIVTGPFSTLADAKKELNKRKGSSSNRQMICEMSSHGGAKADPHIVGGEQQGGGPAAGFEKYWYNWNDIHLMNSMCNKNTACNTGPKAAPTMPPTFAPTPAPTMPPTPAPTPWYCVASASRKIVTGPFSTLADAKKELNKRKGSSSNRQMICEMSHGGAKADPHKVGGENQGGGSKA